MKLTWTKTDKGWFGIYGKFRAEVARPVSPFMLYHWSVRAGNISGGSGGTSSALASKRAAENEIDRFAKLLRSRTKTVLQFPGDHDRELT
jgi:hypothetical protein